MIGFNKRYGVKLGSQPLNLNFPFRSTGWAKPATRLITGPIADVDSSVESLQSALTKSVPKVTGKVGNVTTVSNAGLDLEKIKNAMRTPNPAMAMLTNGHDFYNRPPTAVKSVEAYEEQQAAEREMERQNAKIYSPEELKRRKQEKMYKESAEKEQKQKIAKYFATDPDISYDDINEDLHSEVAKYYASPDFTKTFKRVDFTPIANKRAAALVDAANDFLIKKGKRRLPPLSPKLFVPFPEDLKPFKYLDSTAYGRARADIANRVKKSLDEYDKPGYVSPFVLLNKSPEEITERDVINWNASKYFHFPITGADDDKHTKVFKAFGEYIAQNEQAVKENASENPALDQASQNLERMFGIQRPQIKINEQPVTPPPSTPTPPPPPDVPDEFTDPEYTKKKILEDTYLTSDQLGNEYTGNTQGPIHNSLYLWDFIKPAKNLPPHKIFEAFNIISETIHFVINDIKKDHKGETISVAYMLQYKNPNTDDDNKTKISTYLIPFTIYLPYLYERIGKSEYVNFIGPVLKHLANKRAKENGISVRDVPVTSLFILVKNEPKAGIIFNSDSRWAVAVMSPRASNSARYYTFLRGAPIQTVDKKGKRRLAFHPLENEKQIQYPTEGFGWRAKPLYRMVQPISEMNNIGIDRAKDRESREQLLEKRRDLYKEQQTALHGKPPPTDMIKRAMPDLVEPASVFDPEAAKFVGMVPHTFVRPRKRFRLDGSVTF